VVAARIQNASAMLFAFATLSNDSDPFAIMVFLHAVFVRKNGDGYSFV
jgi:hypothetical protein